MNESGKLTIEIGVKHNNLLYRRKKNTGTPVCKHIIALIDADMKQNPSLYKENTPIANNIQKAKTIDDKVKALFDYYGIEFSVRGITSLLAPYVLPMDRLTLRILVKRAVAKDAVYYKTYTEGRTNARFGLKEWDR